MRTASQAAGLGHSWSAATGAVWPQVPLAAQVLKTHVGMLRPDFLKRCNPDTSVFRNGFVPEIGSTAVPACRSPPSASLEDGHYSFPSGGYAHLSIVALRFRAPCLRGCTESNTAAIKGKLKIIEGRLLRAILTQK